jgi:hypothetical protein
MRGPVGLDGIRVAVDDERAKVRMPHHRLRDARRAPSGSSACLMRLCGSGIAPVARTRARRSWGWCRRWRAARTGSRTATCCAGPRTNQVLGHRVVASSTLATFLRAFTAGMSAPTTRSRPSAPTRVVDQTTPSSASSAWAGSSRSACACNPCPRGDRADRRAAWTTLLDYPPTSIAQLAETTLGGRPLLVRRGRTLDPRAS